MRSHTATMAFGLLLLAVAVRFAGPAPQPDAAAVAVRQFDDPAAADALRNFRTRRQWDDFGWFLAAGALAAVAAASAVRDYLTRTYPTPSEE